MKKAIIYAAALMAGITLVGNPAETRAASAKNVVIKKVVSVGNSTLRESITSGLKQNWGNCTVITIPCIPGIGGETPDAPDNTPDVPDTPDNKPETPEMPDTPDNKPEMPDTPELPDVPDVDVPDNNQPDNSVPDAPDVETPDDDGSQADYHAYVLRVVELVNEERAKAGLKPLTLQKNITMAAQVRAIESETLFSHTRPDGRNFATALTEAGVNYRGSGENIAWGQKTPEQVMNGWMNSAGHRANILNVKYTSIGVGYYQNASGVNYWSQLFTYE